MNCIAKFGSAIRATAGRATCKLLIIAGSLAFLSGCNATASETPEPGRTLRYQVNYLVEPVPAHGIVHVSLQLTQPRSLLRHVTF